MSRIFISHAVADAALAKALVLFLKEAIGVKEKDIFCSSVKGHGIPQSKDFNDYMREKIQRPKLVIVLMTETYLERDFCLMELGATWALSHKAVPIVTDIKLYKRVTATLGLKQAWNINDHGDLNAFREVVKEAIEDLEPRGADTWDEKRSKWKRKLPALLKGLPKPTKVERADFDELVVTVEGLTKEVERLESDLEKKERKIIKLKELKDAKQVADVEVDMGDRTVLVQFDELLSAVRDAIPDEMAAIVFEFAVMDRYGKGGNPDFQAYEEEFQRAHEFDLIDPTGEDVEVLWGGEELFDLDKALGQLEMFLKSEASEDLGKLMPGKTVKMSNKRFWKQHI